MYCWLVDTYGDMDMEENRDGGELGEDTGDMDIWEEFGLVGYSFWIILVVTCGIFCCM
jgi:hypothetical protein